VEGIPTELIYILLFAGIIIVNFMLQKAARRRQQEEAARAEAEAEQEQRTAEEELLEDIWGRTPSQAPAPEPPPAPVAHGRPAPRPLVAPTPAVVAAPRRLHPVRALLKDKRDLRRAAVLVTVFGPCRAQEPPEQRYSR
jgi:hypothetical protein